jgi:hypothetical protein
MIGWAAAWQIIKNLFGFTLKHWREALIISVAVVVFGLWRHSAGQADTIEKLRANITLQKTVIAEYENAQRELDGKVTYEKHNGNIAAESAAAVALGRQSGNGPMAPVLRAEYERVHRLAQDAPDRTR